MINKVTLLGRVGNKEYKVTRNGTYLCYLSIATSRKFLDSHGAHREITTWHNVHSFNKLAEIANKYVQIGDLVYIEGEINNRKIEENGVNRSIQSITANEIKFIPNTKKDLGNTKIPENAAENPPEMSWHDEEIPF